MRYHTTEPAIYLSNYGETYECNHPVYDRCTLYLHDDKGLAVIQQRFNPRRKMTYWTEIDPWLTDQLYLSPGFGPFFLMRAREPVDGLYPTLTIRQAMWALKMKPIPRERWETCFDRKEI